MDDKHQRVVHFIRQSLLAGTIIAGDKLSLSELSERLEISTAPVRDALLRLAERKLVLGGAGSYFYICDYGRDVQIEALEVAVCYHQQALHKIVNSPGERAGIQALVSNMAFGSVQSDLGTVYRVVKSLTRRHLGLLAYAHFSISFDLTIVPPVRHYGDGLQQVLGLYKQLLVHAYGGDEDSTRRALSAVHQVTRKVIRNAHAARLIDGRIVTEWS